MNDYEPVDRAWTIFIIVLIVACGLIACLELVAITSAADDPLCLYFDALATMPGVRVAEWIGYPEGWKDMPTEWDYETFLPILDGGILQRVKGRKQYLWGYRSMATWTDANGEHEGNHDFCEAVLIIDS